MKKILIFSSLIFLLACENGNLVLSEKQRAYEKELSRRKGQARTQLFKDCMALASSIPRKSDDDVSNIVSTCSLQAYYIYNLM